MFWIVVIVIIALFAVCLESGFGKIAVGSGVVAIGLLLLGWITGVDLLFTLAKVCAGIIVVTVVVAILIAIAD